MNHSIFTVSPSADDKKSLPSAARGQNRQNGIATFANIMATAREKGEQNAGMGDSSRLVLAGRNPSDVARAHVFSKAQADLRRTNALERLADTMSPDGTSSLALAGGMNTARQLQNMAAMGDIDMPDGGPRAIRELQRCDYIRTRTVTDAARHQARVASLRRRRGEDNGEDIGGLSAQFESGSDGIAAIGYDRTGGTSYGKYQIASRVGSMTAFLNFLDEEAPDIAERLRSAGPANTGSRKGAMPEEWRAIAAEQPDRFGSLQENFILESHYKPALESIGENTRLDVGRLSRAMREVIWSTAVQHGPAGAARLFGKADDMSGAADSGYEKRLIRNLYALRAGQFGSSDAGVRAAVGNRFKKEEVLALNMLGGSGSDSNLA